MAINYKEHPIERGIPPPEKDSIGKGRNQRLAAKMKVGDSVLIEENRGNALMQCIKKLGGKAVSEDAGMVVAADTSLYGGRKVRHRRVWRVS